MSMKYITPYTLLLKLGIQGYAIFLIFGPKHRLWELIRTASVMSKNIKNIKIFLVKFSIFTVEKILCILHGQVSV